MDSFKVRINFGKQYILKSIVATDEVDACWKAKELADKYKNHTNFDLMRVE